MKQLVSILFFGKVRHWSHVVGNQNVDAYNANVSCEGSAQWQRSAVESQRAYLLDTLSKDYDVDVFVSSDLCSEDDFAGYESYLTAKVVVNQSTTRLAKFEAGLRLVRHHYLARIRKYDFFVITRPDLLWYAPVNVSQFFFRRGIVWPHKCNEDHWNEYQCVGDSFISMDALLFSHLYATCRKAFFQWTLHSSHHTYQCGLQMKVFEENQTRFYAEGYMPSNLRKVRELNNIPYYFPLCGEWEQKLLAVEADLLAIKSNNRNASLSV